MDGYYKTLFPLNPGSIRPVMPTASEHESLSRPHSRESLSAVDDNVQIHVSQSLEISGTQWRHRTEP